MRKHPPNAKRFIYDLTKIPSYSVIEARSIKRTGNYNLDFDLVTNIKFCVTYIFNLEHANSYSLHFLSVAENQNIISCELSSKAIR